jgi:hypothetical protein
VAIGGPITPGATAFLSPIVTGGLVAGGSYTATLNANGAFGKIQTPATINTHVYWSDLGTYHRTDRRCRAIVNFRTPTAAEMQKVRYYIGFYSAQPTANPATGYWAGFKFENTGTIFPFAGAEWTAQENLGLATNSLGNGSIAADTNYEMEIEVFPSDRVLFRIGDTWAFVSLPSGSWPAATTWRFYFHVTALIAAAKPVYIRSMYLERD